MRIKFSLYKNFKEYYVAYLEYILWARTLSLIWIIIFFGIGLYLLNPEQYFMFIVLILICFVFLIVPVIRYIQMVKRKIIKLHYVYSFQQRFVIVDNNHGEFVKVSWGDFSKLVISPHYFFLAGLYRKKSMIIPRSVIPNQNDFIIKIKRYIEGAKFIK